MLEKNIGLFSVDFILLGKITFRFFVTRFNRVIYVTVLMNWIVQIMRAVYDTVKYTISGELLYGSGFVCFSARATRSVRIYQRRSFAPIITQRNMPVITVISKSIFAAYVMTYYDFITAMRCRRIYDNFGDSLEL